LEWVMTSRWGHVALLVVLAGCRDDVIRSREVPKPQPVTQRTLAVLVPLADATWFFKLSGPESAVAADEAAFDAFVASAAFAEGDKPIRWVMPEGWRLDPGGKSRSKMIPRYATLRTANGNEALVTRLGTEPGTRELLGNVNRWRREIGLEAVAEADLPTMSRDATVGGVKATRVDLMSPGKADELVVAAPTEAAAHAAPAHAAPLSDRKGHPKPDIPKVTFAAPAGWLEQPAMGMRAAAFRVGTGEDSAEVTVIPLAGPAGGLANNVNLWRSSLQLPEVTEAEVAASAQKLMVDGRPEAYFDLPGPDRPKPQRILGVIVPRGERSWFIKMRGAASAVGREKANFEAFVQSLKLPGGG